MALEKLKNHGTKFTATGVGHVTSNEMIKSTEMGVTKNKIKAMEDDNKDLKNLKEIGDKAT